MTKIFAKIFKRAEESSEKHGREVTQFVVIMVIITWLEFLAATEEANLLVIDSLAGHVNLEMCYCCEQKQFVFSIQKMKMKTIVQKKCFQLKSVFVCA